MEVNCDSVLFRLPKYVFLNFCSDWISTIDFCKLDSSLTNRTFRLIYDTYTTSGMLVLSDDGNGVTLTKNCFDWLIKRNFLIKSLTAPSNVLPLKEVLRNQTTRDVFKQLKSICFVYNNEIVRHNGNKGILLSGRQETLIESCVLLENLDISRSENMLSAKFYKAVAKHCPLLKVFTAGNCLKFGVTVSCALKAFARGCKLLEVFTTESSHPLDNALVILAENCKHLKVLRFGNNYQKIDYDQMLIALADSCPDLCEFTIYSQFKESALRKFVMSCTLLTKLSISSYNSLTDSVLVVIGCYCKHLTHFDIPNYIAPAVTISGVRQLLTSCTTLTHFSLPRLPYDETLSLFSTTKFDNLVEIQLTIQKNIEGKEFESVMEMVNTTIKFGYRRY